VALPPGPPETQKPRPLWITRPLWTNFFQDAAGSSRMQENHRSTAFSCGLPRPLRAASPGVPRRKRDDSEHLPGRSRNVMYQDIGDTSGGHVMTRPVSCLAPPHRCRVQCRNAVVRRHILGRGAAWSCGRVPQADGLGQTGLPHGPTNRHSGRQECRTDRQTPAFLSDIRHSRLPAGSATTVHR
jgi:hypothetical protein